MQTASNSSQVAVYTRLSHSPSWSPPLSPCSSASDRRRPSELQVWACLQSSKASVLNRAPDCTRRPNSTCCNRVFLKIVFITYMICTECSNISEWKTTSSADSHFQRFLEAVGVPYISCTFSRHQSTTLFFTRNSETRVCFLQSCCPAQEYRWICPCPFDDFRSSNQHTCFYVLHSTTFRFKRQLEVKLWGWSSRSIVRLLAKHTHFPSGMQCVTDTFNSISSDIILCHNLGAGQAKNIIPLLHLWIRSISIRVYVDLHVPVST